MKYNVLNNYEATVTTLNNPFHFEQRQLFDMALRINKKRRFLFVSRVLGKHLALDPAIPLLTSHLLAYSFLSQRLGVDDKFATQISQAIQGEAQLSDVLVESRLQKIVPPHPLTIIGFAETATALGHGFFEKFIGDVQFVHTTREHLVNVEPLICFEEEHSHASSHRVYADESIFLRQSEVILVDDEMTTGKTNANIIRQLHKAYPHLTTFTLVSILDFRTETSLVMMQNLAEELNITIHSIALFNGAFQIEETAPLFEEEVALNEPQKLPLVTQSFEEELKPALVEELSYNELAQVQVANYYKASGRFALVAHDQQQLEDHVHMVAKALKKQRTGGKCLVLGTGEFMYVPMCIAAKMGADVRSHATTRSPIYAHEQSLIYNKFTFPSAEFPGVTNFAYNIPFGEYSDIFVIYERLMDLEAAEILHAQLKPYATHIHFVTLGGVELAVYT